MKLKATVLKFQGVELNPSMFSESLSLPPWWLYFWVIAKLYLVNKECLNERLPTQPSCLITIGQLHWISWQWPFFIGQLHCISWQCPLFHWSVALHQLTEMNCVSWDMVLIHWSVVLRHAADKKRAGHLWLEVLQCRSQNLLLGKVILKNKLFLGQAF